MQWIWQTVQQISQWMAANPRATLTILQATRLAEQDVRRIYRNLSPEGKQKVDAAIRWAAIKAIKFGVMSVFGDLSDLILGAGGDSDTIEFAKAVVKKAVEVGLDKALEEARGTPEGQASLPDQTVEQPTVTPEEREAKLKKIEEEVAQKRAADAAAQERRERDAAIARELKRQEEEILAAQLAEVRRRKEEEARLAEIQKAIEHELDRPWRIARNSGRVGGVLALAAATIAAPINLTGLRYVCCGIPTMCLFFVFTFFAARSAYNSWET